MVKIFNLNLWNYTKFEERKQNILDLIRKHDPDIIVLQEVRDDIKFNKKGDNQAKQLNRELKYPYLEFCQTTDKQKERPEKYTSYCIEGSAILSKFPIIKAEHIKLTKQPDDRYSCGNLYVRIKAEKEIDIVAVHFSNSNLFSLLHLIETLKWIKKKDIKPIIVGDFNMYHPNWIDDLTEEEYLSSFRYKTYLSYPPANYNLDYILIPKSYKFKTFECLQEDVSDHKALVAEVTLK